MMDSMTLTEEQCPPDEYTAYKRAAGRVSATMLSEILEPLYKQHSSLAPRAGITESEVAYPIVSPACGSYEARRDSSRGHHNVRLPGE
jgi:hypothetical protein